MGRRTPTGAALLQPEVTRAISGAVLEELAEQGYGRLAMEAVAKRAGVGKSALYRRWRTKQDMVIAVVAEYSLGRDDAVDTGSLGGDMRACLDAVTGWLTHPLFARILPDLAAESARHPALSEAIADAVGAPRRERGEQVLRRAIARGELSPELDLGVALDLMAAPIYWRHSVRGAPIEPGYLDTLTEMLLRALGASTDTDGRGGKPPRPSGESGPGVSG